jgi:hypothetical protein
MRHLCLDALGRNGIGSHCLGGTGSSTKGRHLVGSDDNTDDANVKSTGSSVPVLGMCGDVGNGYAADNGDEQLVWLQIQSKFPLGDALRRVVALYGKKSKCFSNVC